MLFEGVSLAGLVLLRDSWQCDGTGVLLWAVQQLQASCVFVALAHNPAHYSAVFRKAAGRVSFIQVDSPWASTVGEEMLTPVVTWNEDAERVELHTEAIIEAATAAGGKVAIVDDISPLYYSLDGSAVECIKFVNRLRSVFDTVIVRVPQSISGALAVLDFGCTSIIEVSPLSTGYSREVTGQISIRTRNNLVLRETTNSFFRLSDLGLVPAQLY